MTKLNEIQKSTRTIVQRHPTSIDCAVFRQCEAPKDAPNAGDDAVDAVEIDWEDIGDGKALFIGLPEQVEASSSSETLGGALAQFSALIEMNILPGDPGHVPPRKADILLLLIHDTVKIAYEIVGIDASSTHSCARFVVVKRGDLSIFPSPR